MHVISNDYKRLLYGLSALLAYGSHFYSGKPTSHLPQQSFILMLICLPGFAIAILVLAFVSFVVGWIVYELRKRKVESGKAKSQAMVAAMLTLVLLVLAGCVLAALFFRDSYFS